MAADQFPGPIRSNSIQTEPKRQRKTKELKTNGGKKISSEMNIIPNTNTNVWIFGKCHPIALSHNAMEREAAENKRH